MQKIQKHISNMLPQEISRPSEQSWLDGTSFGAFTTDYNNDKNFAGNM